MGLHYWNRPQRAPPYDANSETCLPACLLDMSSLIWLKAVKVQTNIITSTCQWSIKCLTIIGEYAIQVTTSYQPQHMNINILQKAYPCSTHIQVDHFFWFVSIVYILNIAMTWYYKGYANTLTVFGSLPSTQLNRFFLQYHNRSKVWQICSFQAFGKKIW